MNDSEHRVRRVPRVLLICLDSLIPSAITPEAMPNLVKVMDWGTRFANHRAVVPSETLVNMASMLTGTKVGEHGIVANQFTDRSITGWPSLNLGVAEEIDAWMERHGRLTPMRTFGEYLHAAGQKLAVVSTCSSGATRMIDPHGRALGNFSLSCHSPSTSYPEVDVERIRRQFGACPPCCEPDVEAARYAVDVLLDYVVPVVSPDTAILWVNEPDTSYHAFGTTGPSTTATLTAVDNELGRVFDWWRRNATVECSLFIASDHGHIDLEPVSPVNSDFEAVFGHLHDESVMPEGLRKRLARCSTVYLPTEARPELHNLTQSLLDKPWVGHVFCAPVGVDGSVPPGTHPISLIMGAGARTPDVAFTVIAETKKNVQAAVARADIADLKRGNHGGLESRELECLFLAIGPKYPAGTLSYDPSTTDGVFRELIDAAGLTTGNDGAPCGQTRPFECTAEIDGRRSVVRGTFDGKYHNIIGGAVEFVPSPQPEFQVTVGEDGRSNRPVH
ncbi:alkaline phosphatase family protein [Mesorhizobium waimense]|uniref:alkaline phosphatase family protein n=1 Tax=Mesorhizobium waimense TaxID=1300307 RepID=UPI00142E74FC|nr:alkaline phosphatase family protein [Mesorhizobium waimense]